MQKIISLFKRDYEGNRQVINEVVPGAEWVSAGEGTGTIKWDGTCCMIRDGKLFKRYDAKKGRTPPPEFEPAQEPDPETGHHPGWLPVGDGPEDKWFRVADLTGLDDGTYELCGPHFQGNPEGFETDRLVKHGAHWCTPPRDFDGLVNYFCNNNNIEGIVWHHEDGRMVKIKAKDFGIKRKVATEILETA